MIYKPLTFLAFLLKSRELLLCVITFSFCVKISFLHLLIPHAFKASRVIAPALFLLGIIIGSMMGDFAWMLKIGRELLIPDLPYEYVTFFIRISWAFLIIQYASLAFFIQTLITAHFKPSLLQKVLMGASIVLVLYFLYLAFFQFHTIATEKERLQALYDPHNMPFERHVMRFVILYLINLLLVPGLYYTFKAMRQSTLPKILRKQLSILLRYLITPYLIAETIQAGFIHFVILQVNRTPILTISTLLLIYAIYYCIHQIMGLRFLNIKEQVHHTTLSNHLFDTFKATAEKLAQARNEYEMKHTTQLFFNEAFNIPSSSIKLYMFNPHTSFAKQELFEEFIHTNPGLIARNKLLFSYDEILFSNFYEPVPEQTSVIDFLNKINAAIAIPIYTPEKIRGMLVIDTAARPKECYHKIEYDQMIIFAQFLGNMLYVVEQRDFDTLLAKEKKLAHSLHFTHQSLEQFKESIRSFSVFKSKKQTGIILYKNRRFIMGNYEANQFIDSDLNAQVGHPIAKACREVVEHIEKFHEPHQKLILQGLSHPLLISGSISVDTNMIILILSIPDSHDLMTHSAAHIKDPSYWEYGLYLESTEIGKYINNAFPSTQETILNLKINLLKSSLSVNPVFIDAPAQDLELISDVIHHASKQENLYTVDFASSDKKFDPAVLLFGKNGTLSSTAADTPLLERMHHGGTLFIKNIHLMSPEAQRHLSEFLEIGYFRPLLGLQRQYSAARVLSSGSNEAITSLLQHNLFNKKLFDQLKHTTIELPPLNMIEPHEVFLIAHDLLHHALRTETYSRLLALTDRDKEYIQKRNPESLSELRHMVHHILLSKSRRHELSIESELDHSYSITDPQLIHAARLGKHALKDHRLMILLWEKFKNQNKIATFLGVNRSSVYRRCKEFDLS